MSTPQFAMSDTTRPDGCYITFSRLILEDETGDPESKLFADPLYEAEDRRRLEAYERGDWHLIGIRAVAHITIVKNGTGLSFSIESAGLWGIESDSGEEYFAEVFRQEIAELRSWLTQLDVSKAHITVVKN